MTYQCYWSSFHKSEDDRSVYFSSKLTWNPRTSPCPLKPADTELCCFQFIIFPFYLNVHYRLLWSKQNINVEFSMEISVLRPIVPNKCFKTRQSECMCCCRCKGPRLAQQLPNRFCSNLHITSILYQNRRQVI